MRVAFIAGHLSRRASGVRQMIEGLSGALAARGVGIRVFGIDDAAWQSGDRESWKGGDAQTLRRFGPANFGFVPGLAAALDAFAPDLVHQHGIWMYSSAVSGAWAKRTGGALVISPHGMLAPAALTYSPMRKRVISALFQNQCFERAAAFHATAPKEAADITAYLGDVNTAVIANGVADTAVPRPKWSDRKRRVLAIGRLHPVKGYDRLIAAWARLADKTRDWSLEIAGPDPDGHGDQLQEQVQSLGLQNVTIGPPRYGEERDNLIASSRLFALPSLTENFALTVPEALVCSTPVLASTGAPWEGLADNGCGWWVAPEADQLALALQDALSMPDDELCQMGEAGRAWALAEFGWDGIAQQMSEFYADVLAKRGAA